MGRGRREALVRQDLVQAAKDAITALGFVDDGDGLEVVRGQLDHTRQAERLAEVTVGELAELLQEIHPGVNERLHLIDDYRCAIREAAAEVDSIIKAVRQHVLTRAAAKLRALVIVNRQNREDDA
jgi:hypothetical protein